MLYIIFLPVAAVETSEDLLFDKNWYERTIRAKTEFKWSDHCFVGIATIGLLPLFVRLSSLNKPKPRPHRIRYVFLLLHDHLSPLPSPFPRSLLLFPYFVLDLSVSRMLIFSHLSVCNNPSLCQQVLLSAG